jgi:NAD-dependent dihydropyrimidine dehydrogenase PreA subunit
VIEVVSAQRCTSCGICVKVCPTNVFDGVVGEVPVIARQSDCQTCSMCELYCPADALFVAPSTSPVPPDSPWRDETALAEAGLLGRYRQLEGWGPGRIPSARRPQIFGPRTRGLGRPPEPHAERIAPDLSVLPLDGSLAIARPTPVSGPADT